jgi:hypothetical protein
MPKLSSYGAAARLPASPQKRLETFGQALYGDVWKTALACAMKVQKRTMSYWIAGHTLPDLDGRLKVLATEQIAEQARCAEVMRSFRDQVEGAV